MTVAMNEGKTDEQRATDVRASVELASQLGDLDKAWRMSQALAQSALMPQSLRNKPSDVLVTILYGQEIGLRPMQALQSIYVVNGRPSLSGQLWLAKAREAGHRVELTADEKSATCTITRGDTGEQHTETFTIEDAKRAKLDGKDIWKNYPKRMLGWRAVGHCATIACPEVALGWQLAETVDEGPAEARPNLAQVARQRDANVDKTTGEVLDADVVDDDAVRAEVEALQQQATEPDAPEHADADEPQTDLLGGDEGWPPVTPPGGKR